MIKAVLLDLENTLLQNADRPFAAAFRAQFDAHFQRSLGLEGAAAAFGAGIRRLHDTDGDYASIADRLLAALTAARPGAAAEIAAALAVFYQTAYQQLQSLTAPMPQAPALVEALLEQNLLVAIATNPLYPETAILQRLDWAGLSQFLPDFAFITHSENMRFAKADPAYFAETIARVGIEPDEALVIGDSAGNDIAPARALGLCAWQVSGTGGLGKILDALQQPNWAHQPGPRQLRPSMLEPQYRGNLGALYGLLEDMPPQRWQQRPDPAEWSILQILCHLWQAETQVHQARLRLILAEDNAFIAAQPPPGPHIPPCADEDYTVLARFRRARAATMDLLAGLEPADWQRPARHSIFGLTNLLEMAYFTAQHDRLHITQLCQTLGKCADEE